MAAMEALESSSAQLEPQSLTEISEDDLHIGNSEDEDDVLAAAKKELSNMEAEGDAAEDNDESGKSDQQVNGVLVLSLLDKIIGAVDQIQQTQSGLESRQQEMERSVSNIQGELTKLTKNHSTTSNSVNKMMEKVRKVSVNVKTVRATLEKQGGQIKKLETNEAELLKRRNFKVMIYQDEVKVPSKLNVSKSMRVSESVPGSRGGSMLELKEATEEHGEDAEEGEKENKPAIDLSSDEEGVEIEDVLLETRAERIKRSSLQRVQTLKTVFSKEKMDKTRAKTKENLEKTKQKTRENLEKTRQKTKANLEKTKQKTKENLENTKQKAKENLEKTRHNIEKKMGKLGTRMSVNPERKQKLQTSREKMQKAFTPDHVVYARSKTAVYKVPPFTFHVKKVRDGAVEVIQGTEMVEVSQNAEPFNEVDEEVEGDGGEMELEMMNGGGDDEDEDEEEASHDVLDDNEDKERDSD
ncbi:caveolae-associated protein 1b [Corythoichthys intestinalis]|uniref:caveolae-associated protein 1b n=1 Tax=Corythoichthys intestinalis TaxID=161448 RepID=UPI0025A4DEF7|nr:caveolae-associated protein 1b [Corythoichthys intestinalis]XP_061808106.1 caveolae-associated protein 1-like [Nerophis lumbriciformis]